jgi:hypothetical protein
MSRNRTSRVQQPVAPPAPPAPQTVDEVMSDFNDDIKYTVMGIRASLKKALTGVIERYTNADAFLDKDGNAEAAATLNQAYWGHSDLQVNAGRLGAWSDFQRFLRGEYSRLQPDNHKGALSGALARLVDQAFETAYGNHSTNPYANAIEIDQREGRTDARREIRSLIERTLRRLDKAVVAIPVDSTEEPPVADVAARQAV